MRPEATLTQQSHRVYRHHAVRPTTVGDNFAIFWHVPQACLEISQWDGKRTGDMACLVLLDRANVEDRSLAGPDTAYQFFAAHLFEHAPLLHERTCHTLDFREARRRQLTQRDKEAAYLLVGGTIFNVQTFLCCGDQSGRTQHLEMLRGVGDGNRCLVSQ